MRCSVPTCRRVGSSPLARGTPLPRRLDAELRRFIPARAGNTRPRASCRRRHPVHPRSRGEHMVAAVMGARIIGSSPLARGTLRHCPASQPCSRFIPARAGNTTSWRGSPPGAPVHPRSRGEHVHTHASAYYVAGSSPLARGTRAADPAAHGAQRFIPARAGNTIAASAFMSLPAVHPRSRGEHGSSIAATRTSIGSSPLARGTRIQHCRDPDLDRFIPARAGNTRCHRPAARDPSVHPRSRGEHDQQVASAVDAAGSSPLARGTPAALPDPLDADRFIPARAGNTPTARASPTPSTVHPRSRGEHLPPGAVRRGPAGSSPLARGTHARDPDAGMRRRFISARAGNTRTTTSTSGSSTVHPRSRGEHCVAGIVSAWPPGSSPLARGTPLRDEAGAHRLRFIPARAGNTTRTAPTGGGAPVHPRSRGEHPLINDGKLASYGSSPLARGTPGQRDRRPPPRRFIPARAGNTPTLADPSLWSSVHPRSRGEHLKITRFQYQIIGSSPLARGTPLLPSSCCSSATVHPRSRGEHLLSSLLLSVHPRSRGEHIFWPPMVNARAGSSPLARGTRDADGAVLEALRFIPARAGNTGS